MTTPTMRRLSAALPLLMLTALTPAAAIAQPPVPAFAPGATRLDIVAQGEAIRVPDVADIGAGVVTQAATAAEAMAANARQMASSRAALRRAGIADRDVQSTAVSLQPQYRYAENQPPVITGYQASSTVNVRFHDIAKAGPVLDALVAAGANQINGPTLTVDDVDTALDEARGKAVAKARARAELYAKAAGLRVVRIVSIAEGGGDGVAPPMPMMAMARNAKAAATDIAPGEQRLTVTLNVSFELR